MIQKSGVERISNYQPTDVFDAGIIASNWPSMDGLSIKPTSPVLKSGSAVEVGLDIAGVRSLAIRTTVKQFALGEMLRIESDRDSIAYASLKFHLHEAPEELGTEIEYELKLAGRAFYVKIAQPLISCFVEQNASPLVKKYVNNVVTYLDNSTQQPSRKIS